MGFMDLHDIRSYLSLLATYRDASGLKTQQDLELGQPGEVEPFLWCLRVDLRGVVLVHTAYPIQHKHRVDGGLSC